MTSIRVIVVDDEKTVAQAIADSLDMEDDIEVVGVGHSGLDALRLIEEDQPDVALMDLQMPSMGGLEAIRRIKRQYPTVEVLVLTVSGDDLNLFTALKSGAKGYLLKVSSLEEVTEAVRDVARGQAAIPGALAARVLEEFQLLAQRGPALQQLFSQLTRQESEVLRLIGKGLTNKQIAADLYVELKTVKNHITSIREKLEINTRTEAILIAKESGLVDEATSGT